MFSPGLFPLSGRLHPGGERLLALVDGLPEVGEGLEEVAALPADHGGVAGLLVRLQVQDQVEDPLEPRHHLRLLPEAEDDGAVLATDPTQSGHGL